MNSFRKLKYRGTTEKRSEKRGQKRNAKRGGKDTGSDISGQNDSDAQTSCEK